MTVIDTDLSHLPQFLALVSPTLPVGGFSYSQGLECAIDQGILTNSESCYQWIHSQLMDNLANTDLVVIRLMHNQLMGQSSDKSSTLQRLDEWIIACRETAELRQEERAKAVAMKRICKLFIDRELPELNSFVGYFVVLGEHFKIGLNTLQMGYIWTFVENQVANVVKILPLGQSEGQQLLHRLLAHSLSAIAKSTPLDEEDIGLSGMHFNIISALHENQYTRIYRS